MVAQMLVVWLIANFLPHGVVYLLTGKPYFALDLARRAVAELTIMGLNLVLPMLALTTLAHNRPSLLRDALAWHWYGWRTIGWGLLGLGLDFAPVPLINWLAGSTPFSYGEGIGIKLPQDWALAVLLLAGWLLPWAKR